MSVERHGAKESSNQALQLTAGFVVFLMFFGLRRVLVCRTFFGKSPPQLNSVVRLTFESTISYKLRLFFLNLMHNG